MKITRCKASHLTNPLGFDLPHPVLTWCVEEAEGHFAEAARIVVSEHADLSAPLLDTGFSAGVDSLGYTVNLPQKPRTRYFWQVSVRSDAGELAHGDVQWYETAKLDEPWSAQWIGQPDASRHPVYERNFSTLGEVESARLYICGLGLYHATLNGHTIGDEYLAPGCNNYNAWVQYQTYDVTGLLAPESTLTVALGNGWYKGRFGFKQRPGGFYGEEWKLLAELRIRYTDGREEVLGTGEDWTVRPGQVTFSSIYDGERVDATLPPVPAQAAALCTPPKGKLQARLSPPVRVHTVLHPTLLITPKGERVLDLGQNMAGTFRLRVRQKKGSVLRVQFGETLQDDCFYRDNLRTARAEYVYVSDGEETTVEPRFTFYGGRYVLMEAENPVEAADFEALALSSSLENVGTLETGHPLVNQLIHNVRWSQLDNFLDVPTDCPQRDERMGWTGDAQVFSHTACLFSDAYAFYRKYLHDMATEQAAHGGLVTNVVPAFDEQGTSSVWGDAATIIPWTLYEMTGDASILREQLPWMKAWVDYITRVDGDGCHWREAFHFGDWLALDVAGAAPDNVWGATDVAFIADVHYMYSAELVARAARVLGETADAAAYQALADRLRERIHAEFYSSTGRCCIPTQTGLLLTLRHHLADEEKTLQSLRRQIELSGGTVRTGFVGTSLLCEELCAHGLADAAINLLLNERCPGWLCEVKLGATTVWERWNSLDETGHISSTGMNSLNHYAYGSIVGWMCDRVAGLRAVTPGYRSVEIAPVVDARLGRAALRYRSAAGEWAVCWRLSGEASDQLTLEVTVPFGCTAEVVLPFSGERKQAVSGHWVWVDRKTQA